MFDEVFCRSSSKNVLTDFSRKGSSSQTVPWLQTKQRDLLNSTGGHKSLISEANFFTSRLAVQLTLENISRLVIEANFFSQSARTKMVATAVSI